MHLDPRSRAASSLRISRFRRVVRHLLLSLAVVALVSSASTTVTAQGEQSPLPLNRFRPSFAGDRFFGVPSPYAAGHLDPHFLVIGDYAHNPLVLRRELVNGDEEDIGSVVEHQLFLHLNATFALWNRLAVNVNMPFALLQAGEDPAVGSSTFTSPSAAQIGDLRLGLRGRIWGEYHDPFQIAVGGYLWIPTAPAEGGTGDFVGGGSVRGLPQAILGGRVDDLVIWSLALGPEIQSAHTYSNVEQGTMFSWGGGLGVLLGETQDYQIGVESSGSLTLENIDSRNTNLEVLLGGKIRFLDDWEVGAAAGPGILSGIGTPDVRAVLTLGYTPRQEPESADRDGDGILDEDDACPDEPGEASDDPDKHGCPPPADRDGDGILDVDDACPDKPGVAHEDKTKHGCPPPKDTDGDGIFDPEDACPDKPGVAHEDKTKHGCPPPGDRDGDGITDPQDACPDTPGEPNDDKAKHGCPPPKDTDGDGILDPEDACPQEKGKPSADPKKNGCPVSVRVTDKEIIILQRVEFDTGRATIKPVSDALLDEVAGVLKDHPEITKIQIQGHTDNRGGKAYNKLLSQQRADSVQQAMVKRGIEESRLTTQGYGPDEPIASNDTDEGRQKNRRVQFKILERKEHRPTKP